MGGKVVRSQAAEKKAKEDGGRLPLLLSLPSSEAREGRPRTKAMRIFVFLDRKHL